jgi:hypothetical protein
VTSIPGGWSFGIGFYADAADIGMTLTCPLPVNNVDLGTTSNDNDISSFTVFYNDVDGRAGGAWISATLVEVTVVNGQIVAKNLCQWDSNRHGALASGPVSSNFPCAVDLSATAFYHFSVGLINNLVLPGSPVAISFIGIRFP